MAAMILVTFDEMNTAATQFGNSASAVRNTTNSMLNLVSNTNGEWLGEAGTSYRNKFAQLQGDMNDIFRIITEYMNDVSRILANYKQAESEIKSQITPLDTDVVKF